MFIYQLDEVVDGCFIDLYGNGKIEKDINWKNLRFNGPKHSDEFVASVSGTGNWGLVWDGDSIDECSGQWGEYLKINNPHKKINTRVRVYAKSVSRHPESRQ